MITLEEWTATFPGALRRAAKTAPEAELEVVAAEAVAEAKRTVPVRTGALRASLRYERISADQYEVGTDDPAAAALEAAGRPYVRDAVEKAAAEYGERVLDRLTAAVLP